MVAIAAYQCFEQERKNVPSAEIHIKTQKKNNRFVEDITDEQSF